MFSRNGSGAAKVNSESEMVEKTRLEFIQDRTTVKHSSGGIPCTEAGMLVGKLELTRSQVRPIWAWSGGGPSFL